MVKASKPWIGVVLACAFGTMALAQGHVMQTFGEAKWGPAPPMLPPGAQIAVLAGNPMAAGAYTVRLKFPANYAIPAHSHPTDENVAVVSDTPLVRVAEPLTVQVTVPVLAAVGLSAPADDNGTDSDKPTTEPQKRKRARKE